MVKKSTVFIGTGKIVGVSSLGDILNSMKIDITSEYLELANTVLTLQGKVESVTGNFGGSELWGKVFSMNECSLNELKESELVVARSHCAICSNNNNPCALHSR